MQEFFVGKQPIYNNDLGIFGYEMLFRDSNANAADLSQVTQDRATSITIQNIFVEMGLEKLVGSHYAFINLTTQFLLTEDSIPFDPGQVVLEVLEDVAVSPELIKAVGRLKQEGFVVALDDYIYNPEHKPLVELVDIIKIDIRQLSKEELIEHVTILKKYKIKLLAEKIETLDEFDFCVGLGFDYYQGYFLGEPRVIKGKSLPNNKLGILSLLSIIHNPESEIDEIADEIGRDVTTSYKILKLVNSAFFNLTRKIDSVKDVVVIMGRNKLSSWASVMALAGMDDRPPEMIRLALIRAKMCELLAKLNEKKSLDSYFTVGLFSALDVLMERELSELIRPLPLSEDVVAALLERKGDQGEILSCALACETADFDYINNVGFEPRDLFAVNVEALEWANSVIDIK